MVHEAYEKYVIECNYQPKFTEEEALLRSILNADETIFYNGKSAPADVIVPEGSSGRTTNSVPPHAKHMVAVLEVVDATGRCAGSITFVKTERLSKRFSNAVFHTLGNEYTTCICRTATGANTSASYKSSLKVVLDNLEITKEIPNIPILVRYYFICCATLN